MFQTSISYIITLYFRLKNMKIQLLLYIIPQKIKNIQTDPHKNKQSKDLNTFRNLLKQYFHKYF